MTTTGAPRVDQLRAEPGAAPVTKPDGCAGCTRAFIDVREVSWALRGLGRRLAADGHRGGRHRAPRAGADTQD